MSAEAAYVHFIKPVSDAFREPPGADPEAFFAGLSREMSGFTVYQLEAGARQIRRERTSRSFPTIAECIGACERWPKQEPKMPAPSELREPEEEAAWRRKKDAVELMRKDLVFSRQASKDGWLGQLFDYVMGSGHMPPYEAAGRLRSEAERVRQELIACSGPIGLTLIDAYRARYKSIQGFVFGDGEVKSVDYREGM